MGLGRRGRDAPALSPKREEARAGAPPTHRPAPSWEEGQPVPRGPPAAEEQKGGRRSWGRQEVTGVGLIDSMILPQVHLRKPCYDFSFL